MNRPLTFLWVAVAVVVTGCTTLPPPQDRVETTALTDTAGTRLGRAIAPGVAANPGKTGIHALPDPHDAFATRVRETWQAWKTATSADFHEGALLYLTKYLTPHPPGEPHFFVKPPSLLVSSPGTSILIDGHHGAAYDIMRGVVRSDTFHATPAVFQLYRPGETIRVAKGAPLADLFVYPRTLDDATFESSTAGPGGSW